MSKQYTAADILKLMSLMQSLNIDSLDRKITTETERTDFTVGDLIEDPAPGPQEILERHDMRRIIMSAVSKLTPRQQSVITLRFGLIDGKPRTLEETGQIYGVTRERIRQVENRALKKLKWILMTKYKIKGDEL